MKVKRMPQHQEYISKEAEKLEKQIKEKYGKRGAAMIEAARQTVEYELDSSGYSQIQFVKLLIKELEKRL